MAEVNQVLTAAGRGEPLDYGELFPLVYEELRRLAARRIAREPVGATLQATALVHEVWLRLARADQNAWQNRAHFFGAAAQAMRRILIENARRRASRKRGGDFVRVELEEGNVADPTPDEKIILIHEALQRLESVDPRKAAIVAMKFFGGFSNHEVAACLGTTERTIERQWAYARTWLFQHIRAAQGGGPEEP